MAEKLTKEQAEQVKESLLHHLDKFPEENREQIKEQITSMSLDDVQHFIEENNLSHLQKCIFCSIAKGETPGYIVSENKDNIAVLEINPLTKAHVLVIPKEHTDINDSATQLAKEIAEKIKKHFNPLKISINRKKIMEHPLIEVVPVYENQTPKRYKASEDELKKLQDILSRPLEKPIGNTGKQQAEQDKKEHEEPVIKLKPRIP